MTGNQQKRNGERRRRNAPRANTMKLPPLREGPIPPWPLATPKLESWDAIWRQPQAVAWEGMGVEPVVARYLELREKITDPTYPESQNASFWNVVTTLEDRLGLTPIAMMRLQWEVEGRTEEYVVPSNDDEVLTGNAHVVDLKKRAAQGA